MRSAENLKLFETLFHLQTDSCSTDKITPSFAASLNENNGAHSKTKNSQPIYNKVPHAGLKTVESKSGRFVDTKKKLKKNNFHDDCQVSKKDLYVQKQKFGHTSFTLTRQLVVERRTNNRQRMLSAAYLLK